MIDTGSQPKGLPPSQILSGGWFAAVFCQKFLALKIVRKSTPFKMHDTPKFSSRPPLSSTFNANMVHGAADNIFKLKIIYLFLGCSV